jgi:hypothetical protein
MSLRIGVAVIAYDRPRHLRACLRHLDNAFSGAEQRLPVSVIQDAPEGKVPSRAWKQTHTVARGYPHGNLIVREKHHHVVFNISNIIGELLNEYEALIVLEDDVCVSRDFIVFMLDCLHRYADCEDVMSVCADQFAYPELMAQRDHTLFARFFLRHGFGIWRRSWRRHDFSCTGWEELPRDTRRLNDFNIIGGQYLYERLASVCRNDRPVYDIRWYFNMHACGGFSVMPTRSLVFNAGFAGGVHLMEDPSSRSTLPTRIAWALGLRTVLYQRFRGGRTPVASSVPARRGKNVFDLREGLRHAAYEGRHQQHEKYARLLKCYQRRV